MRPGEKLYEELNLDEEHTLPTYHDKVHIFAGSSLPADRTMQHLAMLRGACERRDLDTLLQELRRMVPDYSPSESLLERLGRRDLQRLGHAVGTVAAVHPQTTPLSLASAD
jgi:FlaA1/EpsC-like NDP-sugar epimerase